MSFFLLELHPPCWASSDLSLAFDAAPSTTGWRLFAQCIDDDGRSCELLFSDPADFGNTRTLKDFRAFLTWLYEAGKGGATWQSVFQDGKLFHPIHTIVVNRLNGSGKRVPTTVQVMQWKKRKTNVRLLFVQSGLGALNIFVSHVFEKDTSTTPTNEKSRAESNVKAFFEALDAKQLQLITSQGGLRATPKFV